MTDVGTLVGVNVTIMEVSVGVPVGHPVVGVPVEKDTVVVGETVLVADSVVLIPGEVVSLPLVVILSVVVPAPVEVSVPDVVTLFVVVSDSEVVTFDVEDTVEDSVEVISDVVVGITEVWLEEVDWLGSVEVEDPETTVLEVISWVEVHDVDSVTVAEPDVVSEEVVEKDVVPVVVHVSVLDGISEDEAVEVSYTNSKSSSNSF